jgi:hypothetical protein
MGDYMKKIISVFTMVAFIIFSLSCYTSKKAELDTLPIEKWENLKVLKVIISSGDVFEFSKKHPGRIYRDTITGKTVKITGELVIDRAEVERAEKAKDEKFLRIITKDGKKYKAFNGTMAEEKDRYIFIGTYETYKSVSIPLSDVKFVWTKSFNLGLTSLIVIIGGAAAFFVGFAIIVAASGGIGN